MKVFFQTGSDDWRQFPSRLETEPNLLALSYNNWNDYGICTTLNASLFIDGKTLLSFALKLLLNNENDTAAYLNNKKRNGWDGFFPIPDIDYVSVPNDIDFYSVLIGKIGVEASIEVLKLIHDAGYLKNIVKDSQINSLIESNSFEISLLREASAKKAYNDGWLVFINDKVSVIDDFVLNIQRRGGGSQSIRFKFNSEILPYDINILIGSNGIGKSYCLKSLVEYWLGVDSGSKKYLEESKHIPFDKAPNISRLILISYSPFEEFTLDLSNAMLLDKEAYKYFGFRKRIIEQDKEPKIKISRNLPASDSVHSLLKAYADDKKLGFMKNWIGKGNVINEVLKAAIGYENLGFSLLDKAAIDSSFLQEFSINIDGDQYLIINPDIYDNPECFNFFENINYQKGVIFIKDNKKIELSSGQRLFCYIVVNVVGEIRQDSLIVIDEPELFLHPTLEIQFISMLKKVLTAFKSKAILATHSLAIAREIPAKCVHVFRELEDGLDVVHPPFETFGADMQRISTYVFGDNSVTKPFDDWLELKLKEFGNAQSLIEALGKEVNEEILLKLLN